MNSARGGSMGTIKVENEYDNFLDVEETDLERGVTGDATDIPENRPTVNFIEIEIKEEPRADTEGAEEHRLFSEGTVQTNIVPHSIFGEIPIEYIKKQEDYGTSSSNIIAKKNGQITTGSKNGELKTKSAERPKAQSSIKHDAVAEDTTNNQTQMTDMNEVKMKPSGCNDMKQSKVNSIKKTFACEDCGKTFGDKSNLKRHKKSHTNPGARPFACYVCGKTFGHKSNLTEHSRKHTGEKPFSCDNCSKTFYLKGNLTQHLKTHTGEKSYACNVCSKTFAFKSSLRRHSRIHTGEKPFTCDYCGKTFGQKCNLTQHLRRSRSRVMTPLQAAVSRKVCRARPKKWELKTEFPDRPTAQSSTKHDAVAEDTTQNEKLTIKISEVYATPSGINDSQQLTEKIVNEYKHCDQSDSKTCVKTCTNRLIGDTGDKPYTYDYCDIKLPQNGDLTDHKQHTSQNQKSFACDDCGQTFTAKGNLTQHSKIHQGVKPFACIHCIKTFSRKNNFLRHLRVHTGEKPFPCDYCGESFSDKTYLTSHLKLHTGEEPLVCYNCGKTFLTKRDLLSHSRVHTGEKPFACGECGKTFGHKGTLTKHFTKHTGEKPVACNECGKTFGYKSALIQHMKKHK